MHTETDIKHYIVSIYIFSCMKKINNERYAKYIIKLL